MLLGPFEAPALLGERESGPVDEGGDLSEAVFRGIPIGDQFKARALGTRAALEDLGAEHVAGAGDDGGETLGQPLEGAVRRREIIRDQGAAEQLPHSSWRRDYTFGRHEIIGVHLRRVGDAAFCHHNLHPTEIVGAGVLDRRKRGIPGGGEHGIRDRTESRGDCGLKPRLHLDMLGDKPLDAVEPGRDESTRAVLLIHRR